MGRFFPENFVEGDGSLFPDGSRAVECTNWARYVRRVHGENASIFGFSCDDNPEAVEMDRLAGGHDFAVLNSRFIIDGWLACVEGEIDDPVLDMQNPDHAERIRAFYGDPERWTHMSDLEQDIDSENPAAFAEAMTGVRAITVEINVDDGMTIEP